MSFDQLNIDGCSQKEKTLAMLGELCRMYSYEISRDEAHQLYEAIKAIPEKTEWISVKDELPTDPYKEALVYLRNGSRLRGTYFKGRWIIPHCGDDEVTHWMPLPEPPNINDSPGP